MTLSSNESRLNWIPELNSRPENYGHFLMFHKRNEEGDYIVHVHVWSSIDLRCRPITIFGNSQKVLSNISHLLKKLSLTKFRTNSHQISNFNRPKGLCKFLLCFQAFWLHCWRSCNTVLHTCASMLLLLIIMTKIHQIFDFCCHNFYNYYKNKE